MPADGGPLGSSDTPRDRITQGEQAMTVDPEHLRDLAAHARTMVVRDDDHAEVYRMLRIMADAFEDAALALAARDDIDAIEAAADRFDHVYGGDLGEYLDTDWRGHFRNAVATAFAASPPSNPSTETDGTTGSKPRSSQEAADAR